MYKWMEFLDENTVETVVLDTNQDYAFINMLLNQQDWQFNEFGSGWVLLSRNDVNSILDVE